MTSKFNVDRRKLEGEVRRKERAGKYESHEAAEQYIHFGRVHRRTAPG
jgi:hypothetical protein